MGTQPGGRPPPPSLEDAGPLDVPPPQAPAEEEFVLLSPLRCHGRASGLCCHRGSGLTGDAPVGQFQSLHGDGGTRDCHMREALGTIEQPAGEGLLTLRKQGVGSSFYGICVSVKDNRARLGKAWCNKDSCNQGSAKECSHDPNRQSITGVVRYS